ncbi:MAG: hypothetical protein R3F02_17250 [Thiolinea sp.]
MKDPVVIIGIGEIGSVLARGFLRSGHPVYPVTSNMNLSAQMNTIPEPALVVVAVGETALDDVLQDMPAPWRKQLVLIQNELLPPDWLKHGIDNPTVVSVWFEKKKGQDVKVVVPSTVFGPHAGMLIQALDALEIPATQIADADKMTFELVRKNYYILVSNIAGLVCGGTVSTLWNEHNALARSVAADVHSLQEHLTGQTLDHDALIAAMVIAFEGDPEHKCMGRSAPARLERALKMAEQAGLAVPALEKIQSAQDNNDEK